MIRKSVSTPVLLAYGDGIVDPEPRSSQGYEKTRSNSIERIYQVSYPNLDTLSALGVITESVTFAGE